MVKSFKKKLIKFCTLSNNSYICRWFWDDPKTVTY